jgi:hypothetical protein
MARQRWEGKREIERRKKGRDERRAETREEGGEVLCSVLCCAVVGKDQTIKQ